MQLLKTGARILRLMSAPKPLSSVAAYRLWASQYDQQPGNLMMDLDVQLLETFLKGINVNEGTILDVGCGTGRHWQRLLDLKPARLAGVDISPDMLEILQQKFPGAEVYASNGMELPNFPDSSCNLLVSTLTIAHLDDAGRAIEEWSRVLCSGGQLVITDFHPEALALGGRRTFNSNGNILSVRNHVHLLKKLRHHAKRCGLEENAFREFIVDENVMSYYQEKNAMQVFEKYYGIPVIYGIRFCKK